MCGISGLLDRKGRHDLATLGRLAEAMATAQRHRGPDDQGVWVEEGGGIALSHRRLSILDLSPAGHQPFHSPCGRYVLVYNGEVYNFRTLRAELEQTGQRFQGHSDTEIVLAAIVTWGLEAAIERFVGMFAFALWDRQEQVLHLVRDRLGIKPLYWGEIDGVFLFASELKALEAALPAGATGAGAGAVDDDAIQAYLEFGYIPCPLSIYRAIHKLPPGCRLELAAGKGPETVPRIIRYWDSVQLALQGLAEPLAGSPEEQLDRLEAMLKEAVACRMVADVPVGAFLSGGIDSSLVVALMRAAEAGPVRSFTIGFAEASHDESGFAREVARHLGSEHHDLTVTEAETLALIPELPRLYDEPFGDSSQVPTFLVSRLCRAHVTVALSGDGGDELFAGYNRYVWGSQFQRLNRLLPRLLRRGLAWGMTAVPERLWDRLFSPLAGRVLPTMIGDKIHKSAPFLTETGPETLYRRLVASFPPGGGVRPGRADSATWERMPSTEAVGGLIPWMQLADTLTYLPGDILTKVDRASMANALEVRVPLLDHRVLALAWRLPMERKLQGRQGKGALRALLARHLPPAAFERPKSGFALPLGTWLRGPLKGWAEEVLLDRGTAARIPVPQAQIEQMWTQHLSGSRNWQHQLWVMLILKIWLQTNGTGLRPMPLA